MMFRFLVLAVITTYASSSTLPPAPNTTPSQVTPTTQSEPTLETKIQPLSCVQAEGTMPDWEDDTCQSYFMCENYVLTEHVCSEDEAFSLKENTCVSREKVNCEQQNKVVRITLRASAYLYNGALQPSYELTNDDEEGGALPLIDMGGIGELWKGLSQPHPRAERVKRQTAREMGVPSAVDAIDKINVTLPEAVCERINYEVPALEGSVNTFLMKQAGCTDARSCNVSLVELHCEDEDDEMKENENINKTETSTGDHHNFHDDDDDDDDDHDHDHAHDDDHNGVDDDDDDEHHEEEEIEKKEKLNDARQNGTVPDIGIYDAVDSETGGDGFNDTFVF